MEFILIKSKEGKLIIYGGYGLKIDAESDSLKIENVDLVIEIEPPITRSTISELIEQLKENLMQNDLKKLSRLLKSVLDANIDN